jgi:hypothetical protein
MGTRGSLPEVKWPEYEAYHLPPSNAEVKNAWSCTSISSTLSWRGKKKKKKTGVEYV